MNFHCQNAEAFDNDGLSIFIVSSACRGALRSLRYYTEGRAGCFLPVPSLVDS